MYPAKIFFSDRLEDALEIAGLVKFAAICLLAGDLAELVFAPFVVEQEPQRPVFKGHLVRSNPLFALLENRPLRCRLLFNAADAYISPSIYREKKASGKVVPTWNYVAAQFEGVLERVPDEQLLALLDFQVTEFEKSAGSDWKLADAPTDYAAQMSKAVFGIRFTPQSWKTHKKLSQNKPTEKDAVISWARSRAGECRTIPYWMGKPGS